MSLGLDGSSSGFGGASDSTDSTNKFRHMLKKKLHYRLNCLYSEDQGKSVEGWCSQACLNERKIEITPEMFEAGEQVLLEIFGDGEMFFWSAPETAVMVFLAMVAWQSPKGSR